MSWLWVVGGLVAWLVLASAVALVIGRGIRLADRRDSRESPAATPLTTADLPASFVAPAPVRRRAAVPLPPVGVALAACAVALETCGFVFALTGTDGSAARLLSMDAPLALPRMFVAMLFAAAAVAAVVAAVRFPGRRTWWLGVALVGGGIASVKAGGTVHAEAMQAVEGALGARAGLVISLLAAGAVLLGLWSATRAERRDRRRILGALASYAVAAVGLSAVSGAVPGNLYAVATYLEESGEALAGVAFLMAVFVGVAPHLVLPADWALRRAADAQPLEIRDPAGRQAPDARA